MEQITLSPPKNALDWLRVRHLYRQAFPASERKPFSIIRTMYRRHKTDLWCIFRGSRFLGFASTINAPDIVLLDYLAICPHCRGEGVGSEALVQLMDRYRSRGFFVEIESTLDPGPDQHLRLKRKHFYQNAGLTPLGVSAMVFGVKMELLGYDCQMDFSGYRSFYRDHYNPWAAEHIQPVV